MRKVINGKLYDTDTAESISSFWNGVARNDFDYFEETLYRTKKGAWFLVGEGGARSRYSEPVGGGRTSGSDIISLSEGEAYDWCERYDKIDVIEEYFSDYIEEA